LSAIIKQKKLFSIKAATVCFVVSEKLILKLLAIKKICFCQLTYNWLTTVFSRISLPVLRIVGGLGLLKYFWLRDLLLVEATVTNAHLLSDRPPRDNQTFAAALITETLSATAAVVFPLGHLYKRLLALGALDQITVRHPVGRRYLVGHPLLGNLCRLGGNTVDRLAYVGDIVDDLAREVMRGTDVILLAGPDVLQLGADH